MSKDFGDPLKFCSQTQNLGCRDLGDQSPNFLLAKKNPCKLEILWYLALSGAQSK